MAQHHRATDLASGLGCASDESRGKTDPEFAGSDGIPGLFRNEHLLDEQRLARLGSSVATDQDRSMLVAIGE